MMGLRSVKTAEVQQTIDRADVTTLAVPDGYYGDTGGNRVHDLEAISTRKVLDFGRRNPANPLGTSETDGFYL